MKKCPYCAEEIQDEAIVCKYCGRDLLPRLDQPQPKPSSPDKGAKKGSNWLRTLLIVAVGLVGFCVFLAIVVELLPDAGPTTGSEDEVSAPTQEPTTIPTITPSSLTMGEIENNRGKLTEAQWEDYAKSLVGARVHWTGSVRQVTEDGTICLDAGQGAFRSVYLDGLSQDVWKTLNKDQVIEFEATISRVTTFLGLSVWLDTLQLFRYASIPGMPRTKRVVTKTINLTSEREFNPEQKSDRSDLQDDDDRGTRPGRCQRRRLLCRRSNQPRPLSRETAIAPILPHVSKLIPETTTAQVVPA